MYKKIVFSLLLLFLMSIFISCQSENHSQNSLNELLPERINVYTEVSFLKQNIEEWLFGVDTNYLKQLNQRVLSSNVTLYEGMPVYTSKPTAIEDKSYIKALIKESTLGISSLYFVENWVFKRSTQKLEKQINNWAPVLQYYRTTYNETTQTTDTNIVKTLLYNVDCNSSKADKCIAKSIFYEQQINKDESLNEYLDSDKLAQLILFPVLEGKQKVFDFFDNSPLKINEIYENFGVSVSGQINNADSLKTLVILDAITAYVFEEDWYINPKTFTLRKEIKSISPVYQGFHTDQNGDLYEFKKILFKLKY